MMCESGGQFAVKVCSVHAQGMRRVLEEFGFWDEKRKLQKVGSDQVLIPVRADIECNLLRVLSEAVAELGDSNESYVDVEYRQDESCDVSGGVLHSRTLSVVKAAEGMQRKFEIGKILGNTGKEAMPPDWSHDGRTLWDEGDSVNCNVSTGKSSLLDSNFVLKGMEGTLVTVSYLPPSKKTQIKTPHARLKDSLRDLAKERGVSWTRDFEREIPRHWEVHGDLALLPDTSFRLPEWSLLLEGTRWGIVADALGCRRLARKSRIQSDDYRSPRVDLLFGDNSWVEHVDNQIRYCYDIKHSMFSAGNISEKIRVGSFICHGETVVDLFAGIGYFVLPYLVHAGAKFVHACEWNPHAVEALKRNLELNKVQDKCQIHLGDNREVCPKSVADRVNLGLIPSSESSWSVACAALKPTGGILHIHGNVESYHGNNRPQEGSVPRSCKSEKANKEHSGTGNRFDHSDHEAATATVRDGFDCNGKHSKWMPWARHVQAELKLLLKDAHGGEWEVEVFHLEHVKSYAPHVDHLVADVSCRPNKTVGS